MSRCRLATPSDLDACLAFEWTRTRDDLAWHVAAELLFVAESDGALVGYLRLESFWKTMPYLALIVVRPELRGRGIGGRLLQCVREQLRERGYRSLLSSTTAGEDGPRRWHERQGFAVVGVLRGLNEGDVDEVFYRLAL